MNAESATQLVIVLLSACAVASLGGWARFGRTVWPPIALVLLGAAGVVAAVPDELDTGRGVATLVAVLAGTTAVLGGGPLTTRVFAAVDAHTPSPGPGPDPIEAAGAVLRGGAWIGALERGAVFASLAVGMPEGVAIVLALKGLGRYAELQTQASEGAAERFIIGTFTSVLWAAACAGVVAVSQR